MAEADLLGPDDDGWAEALQRVPHDVYHLPGYVRLDAERSGGAPVAFRYTDGDRLMLLPLVLRPVPDSDLRDSDLRDAASPYGYPGPVSNAAPDDEVFWTAACHALAEQMCVRGVVTLFVRLHPLLPVPLGALATVGTLVHHGQTVALDLTLTVEEMWSQTHRTHRNQINKARRADVSVVVDDWDILGEWVDIYHATMRRVGATGFYFFEPEYFHRLRKALGPRLHLASAVAGGDLLGGNLFFEHDGIMHTHLQATRDGQIHYADKLLYDEIRRWGKDRGNRIHHLGGGLGGGTDSLFRFKSSFGAGRTDFHTWRVVTDPDTFGKLAGPITPESMTNRFPPYR
jgi:hypothetical protein